MSATAPSVSPVLPGLSRATAPLPPGDSFLRRHLGPDEKEVATMLATLGFDSLEALIASAVPAQIRLRAPLDLPAAKGEHETLVELRELVVANQVFTSCLGQGYHPCITAPVIQRNILENPGWYTAYTPYQAEIAQGRLEALLNFQTMVCDLTGLAISNASLLDESTAAAEAMAMCHAIRTHAGAQTFFVSSHCHPQTIAVIATRAKPLGIKVRVESDEGCAPDENIFGALFQYPGTDGAVRDLGPIIKRLHAAGGMAIVAADLLALTLLRPPGEFGADVAVGSTQRLGVPLGFGGPHAAYFATRDEFKRHLPGRLVGVSHDAEGHPAYRLSLQTREQHIRREKATSNICTAQVLLAVIASMHAVYHGPNGLRKIAARIHLLARLLAGALERIGCEVAPEPFFETIRVRVAGCTSAKILQAAAARRINLRALDEQTVTISLDETTDDIRALVEVFGEVTRVDFTEVARAYIGETEKNLAHALQAADQGAALFFDETDALFFNRSKVRPFARTSDFLTHPVFNKHHTETEMLRYIRRLEAKDLSLTTSMIPLGSCTMKLNATSEMIPLTWRHVGLLHPFAPAAQTRGYQRLFKQLEGWFAEITGFAAVSLQPNAGSQGEYAGLLAIREFHASRGEAHRNVCLIPQSAHGTNPASAAMAGFRVVAVRCVSKGDIDLADLRAKTEQHRGELACLMVTYPSTHGVFEETIREVCEIIHAQGGQVYMDGANMNAQVGLCRPGDFGADVCHLNLHKTFCIPHGGGGPGVGPIGVAAHLAPFLPGHFVFDRDRSGIEFGDGEQGKRPPDGNFSDDYRSSAGAAGAVAAAPWGSASILVIPWIYIRMMGGDGLKKATEMAILNANYLARRLEPYFPVLYKGKTGLVAHECILDLRGWKSAGLEVEDVAKRLMDYGFHAPTISWPVPGTMMIEPTESESKEELDRFCEAMISIRAEMAAVENGTVDRVNNLLKNAPHTARAIAGDRWERPYSREAAAFPAPWTREHKFWPAVARIDSVYGDRNLLCSCPPVEAWV